MQQKKIASVMLWVLLLCGSSVIFAKGMPDQVQDKLRVAQYKLQDLDLPEQANIPDFLNIAVQFNGEVKELALEKRSVRSEDFRVLIQGSDGRSTEIDPGPVRTYWGTVVGERDSVVAATLTDAGLEAQVFNCEDAGWSVYPGQGIDKSFRRTQHVIFDNADQAPQGNPDAPDVPDMLNGMPVAGYNGSAAISAPTALFTAGTASYAGYGCDVWQAEAGVDFEYRYYNEFAGGSSAVCQERAETTTNFMNGVYIQNLMVSYTLKTVVVRTSSAACPYYSSGDKLNAMRAEWNANYPNHDIAALVCYGSGAIGGGVAWVSSIANGNHYSVNDADGGGSFFGIWRHEAGHNWGANDYHGGCLEGPTLMCGNAINRFAGKSVDSMMAYRDTRVSVLENLGPWPTSENVPPYAHIDLVAVSPGQTVTIDVLDNDHDANCDGITIDSFDSVSSLGGTITLSVGTGPGGRDQLTYTVPGKLGEDSFYYTIVDDGAGGLTDKGPVLISVMSLSPQILYDMEEASGTTAYDSSVNGNNGELYNGHQFGTESVVGKYGNALHFDGIDDDVWTSESRGRANAKTVAMYVRPMATYDQTLFEDYNGTSSVQLSISGGKLQGLVWDSSSASVVGQIVGPNVSANVWSHVAYVYDNAANHAELYVNGSSAGTATAPLALNDRVVEAMSPWPNRFYGSLDDFRIYGYALIASEISDIYNGVRSDKIMPVDNTIMSSSLVWVKGPLITEHDLYLGTSETAVLNATSASIEYIGRLSGNSYDPNVQSGTDYYWRLDTVIASSPVVSNEVWKFTTGVIPVGGNPITVSEGFNPGGGQYLDITTAARTSADTGYAWSGHNAAWGISLLDNAGEGMVDISGANWTYNGFNAWTVFGGDFVPDLIEVAFKWYSNSVSGNLLAKAVIQDARGFWFVSDDTVVDTAGTTLTINAMTTTWRVLINAPVIGTALDIGGAGTPDLSKVYGGGLVTTGLAAGGQTRLDELKFNGIISNNPPAFNSDPVVKSSALEGSNYSETLTGDAWDPDSGQTLTFSLISDPSWLAVASNGQLSGVPADGDVGPKVFTVRAADNYGLYDEATLNIEVIGVDNPPAWNSSNIFKASAIEGLDYAGVGQTLADDASDPDTGDVLTFSMVSEPAWLTVAPDGQLSGIAADADTGANAFTVRVTDAGGLYDEATLYVSVLPRYTGELGLSDLTAFAAQWLDTSCGGSCKADLDGEGDNVDMQDWAIFAGYWLK